MFRLNLSTDQMGQQTSSDVTALHISGAGPQPLTATGSVGQMTKVLPLPPTRHLSSEHHTCSTHTHCCCNGRITWAQNMQLFLIFKEILTRQVRSLQAKPASLDRLRWTRCHGCDRRAITSQHLGESHFTAALFCRGQSSVAWRPTV